MLLSTVTCNGCNTGISLHVAEIKNNYQRVTVKSFSCSKVPHIMYTNDFMLNLVWIKNLQFEHLYAACVMF